MKTVMAAAALGTFLAATAGLAAPVTYVGTFSQINASKAPCDTIVPTDPVSVTVYDAANNKDVVVQFTTSKATSALAGATLALTQETDATYVGSSGSAPNLEITQGLIGPDILYFNLYARDTYANPTCTVTAQFAGTPKA